MSKKTDAPRVTTLPGILGPVSVAVVDSIRYTKSKDQVSDAIGYYDSATRTIQIEKGQSPEQEHQTREHEWVHSVLFDTGVSNILTHEETEAVCDALGLGLALRLHLPPRRR